MACAVATVVVVIVVVVDAGEEGHHSARGALARALVVEHDVVLALRVARAVRHGRHGLPENARDADLRRVRHLSVNEWMAGG